MTTTTIDIEALTLPDDPGIDPICDFRVDRLDGPQCPERAAWWVTSICPPCQFAECGYMCARHGALCRTALRVGLLFHECGRTVRPDEMTWRPL